MKSFAYYAALPDFMSGEELDHEFVELLDHFDSKGVGSTAFIKSLLELSDRQWHTYSLLDIDIKGRIEQCLMSLWNGHDLERTEEIISVMAHLGLEVVRTFLASRLTADVSLNVFNEISLALPELGDSISDPYSGMR